MSEFILGQYVIALLITGIVNLLLCLFVISRNFKRRINQTFALYSFSLALWSIFEALGISVANESHALLLWRINHTGVIFIPIFLIHFIFCFLGIKDRRRKFIPIFYAIGFVFLILNTTPLFILNVEPKFSFRYFINPGYAYYPFLALWLTLAVYSNVILLKEYFKSTGFRRKQMKHFSWALVVSYIGGVPNFLPTFNIEIPHMMPYGTYAISLYAVIVAYSIIRYHLMDITLVVTRVGLFVFVYMMVLGLPFGLTIFGRKWLTNLLAENWFWAPTISLLVLATAGPFIYLFIQRKAENVLLQEERRINSLLTQASYGMTTIRNLSKLLNLIVDVLQKILRVEKAQVFILNQAVNEYELKAPENQNGSLTVNGETALIEDFIKRHAPLVGDEIRFRARDNPDDIAIQSILSEMNRISCSVIVPIAVDSALLGFIALGDRKGKETYSPELLNVLGVLGNQAALAVRNCYFLQEEAMRMEKLGLEERRVSLDHLTSSMAHEIDNPMMVIHGQVEGLQEVFQDLRISMPDDVRERMNKSMEYILEARNRVSGMIQAIKEYSRKTTGLLKPVKMHEVEQGYWKLFSYDFRREENKQIKYTKEIADNLPYILGDKIQLEEVFFNLANNALHAVRRSDVKEIKLKIFRKDEDWIRMEYSDTGCGIEKNIIGDIFLAHVTTKGSTEGSGLGLYRVRKIIELHNGRIWAESAGKNQGAKIIVEFPVFKGDIKAYLDKGKAETPKKMF